MYIVSKLTNFLATGPTVLYIFILYDRNDFNNKKSEIKNLKSVLPVSDIVYYLNGVSKQDKVYP